jgi:four helix bundle protein
MIKISHSPAPLAKVRGAASLRAQLFDAADSVVLNIAQGAGRNSRDDKRRVYKIAKGSATECAAALQLLRCRRVLSEAGYQARRTLLIRVVQMLSRLCGPPR